MTRNSIINKNSSVLRKRPGIWIIKTWDYLWDVVRGAWTGMKNKASFVLFKCVLFKLLIYCIRRTKSPVCKSYRWRNYQKIKTLRQTSVVSLLQSYCSRHSHRDVYVNYLCWVCFWCDMCVCLKATLIVVRGRESCLTLLVLPSRPIVAARHNII